MRTILIICLFLFSAISGYGQSHELTHLGKYITLQSLGSGAYIYTCSNSEFPSNGLIYIANNEALLVDAPDGAGIVDSLLGWIKNTQHAIVKAVVITHWHQQDRMGGIDAINKAGLASYCSDKTLQEAKKHKRGHPSSGFKDSLWLNIGDKKVLCKYPGEGHTRDNIVVWLPAEKVLFGGCLVKDAKAQNLGYTADANLKAWPNTVKNVLRSFPDAAIVIPGHFNYGSKDLLYHTVELLEKK